MFLSQLFTKTSKAKQSDASSVNADLLTRAGFISKTMAGVYTFLPLGWKVLQKIENIVREEMDTIGAELFMPSLSPVELWQQTGRYDTVSVLFQAVAANPLSKKTNDATYVLNSTHEEVITPIVQQFNGSYQDFPCATYQIQTKFRNEARPKSGILRGREFRMKDLYSFHTNEQDMIDYLHKKAKPAYVRVFDRLGLGDRTVVALASGGDFSKEPSVEFQTKCELGEDHIFFDAKSGVYYNREIAPCIAPVWGDPKEKELPRKDVEGKGIIGVDALAKFMGIEVERTTKTMLYETNDGRIVAAAVRGGYDVNEQKLREVLGCTSIKLASVETVRKVTGAEVGYAGPIGLPKEVEVIWDDSASDRKNFECGANMTNMHSSNINFGRDVPMPKKFYDIKVAQEGDLVPETKKPYEVFRACEVGNLFTLYTKFSKAFKFEFTDKDGKLKPVYMGSYGLGTTRVMGVLAEVYHDEHGLMWPENVAPAHVHIVPIVRTVDEDAYKEAIKLYEELRKKKVEVLFDDRIAMSVGERLADADLIGVPKRIVVSPKTLKEKSVELKDRKTGKVSMVAIDKVVASL